MARPHLKRILLAVVGLVVAVPVANATYAVLDSAAVAKLVEQIKEMKAQYAAELEQLGELKQSVSFLNDISGMTKEVQDAMGKVGSMTLPIPNLQKLSAQTKSDLRCLMPESGLKWGIKTEDMNLGSICETSAKYRQALFFDGQAAKGMTFFEQDKVRKETSQRRTALLEDTAARSLAQADIQLKQADELNNAADQLQTDLNSAQTMQDRAHVQAQIGIAQTRAMARQTQLLAQLLKLQTATAIKAGLPADKIKEIMEGEEGK